MDKLVLRARIEDILEEYEDSIPEVLRDDLADTLVAEFTKIDMEEQFDAEDEDVDDLDEG